MISTYIAGTACSFTGHRPEKLPWGADEHDPRCIRLKNKLMDAVRAVYDAGIRHYICGMAKGCDMYFAEAVITLRDEFDDITIEAAIPCESQSTHWSYEERKRYFYVIHQCDFETILQKDYSPDCMIKRNKYMVDNSSVLIAVFDGSSGGTKSTLKYAAERGMEIIHLTP